MATLLDEKNQCGQTLLRMTSRGNAIVAELLRLADNVPEPYLLRSASSRAKYEQIVLDFAYFQRIEYFDNKIDTNPDLQDVDEQLRASYMPVLTRFYNAFESVYKYVTDIIKFLEDVDEGVYIYQTMENILADKHGKQLMAEMLYLYGCMLLLVDMRIPGLVRERMIVAYQRYCLNEADMTNVEAVIKLFRSTGYSHAPGAKRPAKYPEEYLARVELPSYFVQMVIGRLRTDDIYQQMTVYPEPEHRSAALASQAAMLYVILYFEPTALHREPAKMREIVDKHFPDNWVINLYMGTIVNLAEAWEPYKAASAALNNTLESSNVQLQAGRYLEALPKLTKQAAGLLKEGVLVEEYVLDNTSKLMRVMRKINVTLRWLILHTHNDARTQQHRRVQAAREEIIKLGFDAKPVFDLLLSCAQYEFLLKEMFNSLLEQKQDRWDGLKKEASDRMNELSDVFGGTTPLTRVEVNTQLRDWFKNMGSQIASLDYSDSTAAGRKIMQLFQALEEVQSFHQLESSLQVRQFLKETQSSLQQMIRTINIKDEFLSVISDVADLSYAWEIIDNYTGYMQAGIKQDPTLVIKLRATFLKLASAMELPVLRIHQADSPDLFSVSQFYSSELVSYVRRVLQIIPRSMFEILAKVIAIRTRQLKEVPTRLEKDQLKEYAQLDLRYEIAELTYQISVFTEGILMMKSTLVGVIKIDPKQLLEDGIRRELVTQVARALDEVVTFEQVKGKMTDLHEMLQVLRHRMLGFRRSFEYIQDYVDIYGLRIWQEEVSRIVNYNVEQECNAFLREQITDEESIYQSRAIPIPRFQPRDNMSMNFVGRLARELLRLTNPSTTLYLERNTTWYDIKTKSEIVHADTFQRLLEALDTFGLAGLDKLFCFMIVHELQRFERTWQRQLKQIVPALKSLSTTLQPLAAPPATTAVYATGIQQLSKVFPFIANVVFKVGHIQLLRRMIATQLNSAAKFDGKLLLASVKSVNQALLAEIETHYRDPSKPFPGGDTLLLPELSAYSEAVGVADPLQKIYVTTTKLDEIASLLFFFSLSQLQRFSFARQLGTLVSRKQGDDVDGTVFIAGLITLLRQFHVSHQLSFQGMFAQHVRAQIQTVDPKSPTLSADAINSLVFLEEMAQYCKTSRATLMTNLPPYIVDEFRRQTQ
ncbi:uncharacterized protein MONBRDRAFT_34678 [Monosiga brevicollis MX1]|uniref:WASH complex subunit strumpellin n=1 Tax=Monosiga brevicollis TaxID=81824 RepID=A9VDA5_MONBE|nr:uncharacterized protein MONBRDRAFT_34678 [Monosiga brevicollis MX1]EDQ84496.1 predicted protein [Monosiga brevicollis MX1]|eukprot:XP_001750683.1 hypothetical protein [Monosiga brevicollis MX1]